MERKPEARAAAGSTLSRWFRRNRLTAVTSLGVAIAGGAYAVRGRALVEALYAGTSWPLLNRIITRQAEFDLVHYQHKLDVMVYGYGTMAVLGVVFFSALGSGRTLKTGRFLVLLVLLGLANAAFVLPVHDFGAFVLNDDLPKFQSTAVEGAEALLRYGSPFGYNHGFQGGIPALYLKSGFLCFLPFLLVFGEQVGHQLMLALFLVLIPVSLYVLLRTTMREEPVAQLAAFLAAFLIRMLDPIDFGMTPAVLSIPLFFLGLAFLRQLAFSTHGRRWLPAALLTATVLLYTHLIYFLLLGLVFALVLVPAACTGRLRCAPRRLAYFAILLVLAGLPLLVSVLDHGSLYHATPELETPDGTGFTLAGAMKGNLRLVTEGKATGRLLLLSTAMLFVLMVRAPAGRVRARVVRMVLLSGLMIALPLLGRVQPLEIPMERVRHLAPFVAVASLGLCLGVGLGRRTRLGAACLGLGLLLSHYPLHARVLETVDTRAGVDSTLHGWVTRGEHVLLENSAHLDPVTAAFEGNTAPDSRGHWLPWLQRHLGVRCFSNIGEDPHTYMKHRHMYVTNGTYRGKPLAGANGDSLLRCLESWGVSKVCVWSPAAIAFFDASERFSYLGASERFRCYRAVSDPPEEVRLSGGGRGKVIEAAAFSMTIRLTGVTRPQTVTVARNRDPYWSARDESGADLPLKKNGPMMAFDVERDGLVRLAYRRQTALWLIALAALLLGVVYRPGRDRGAGLVS